MGNKNDVSRRFIEAYERLLESGVVSDKKSFASNIGVSSSMITEIHKGRSSVGTTAIQNIVLAYGVSPDWLLTGEGCMMKEEAKENNMNITAIHQPKTLEKKQASQVVYLYDFKASAGLRSLFDNNQHRIIDDIHIPNLPKCDGAIHIVGDSMYPLLKSGDIILYKQMPLDIENLLYGEMYLLSYDIDGEDYIVVKYVRKSGKGEPFITLGSENPEHAARDIDFRRVNALALVKASVRINSMK